MKKLLPKILVAGLALLLLYAAYIKIRSLDIPDGGRPLAVRWEGFYHDINFRDVGDSLNHCLGRSVFKTGRLLRSAVWFSGWSCDKVGNPDLIFSLNYSPAKAERYFCQGDHGKTIGRYTNPGIQLSDLEFVKTWENPAMRQPACAFIGQILQAVADGKRTLVHCNAGRDRTGAVSALIAGLAAENRGILSVDIIEAIECDYRKTTSLDPTKFGRMSRFLNRLQDSGGISRFLERRCNLDPALLSEATRNLIH